LLIGCSPALPISSSRRRHKAKKSTVFCLGILSQLKLKAGIKKSNYQNQELEKLNNQFQEL